MLKNFWFHLYAQNSLSHSFYCVIMGQCRPEIYYSSDMSISVHCRSRRDLEIRDLVRFSRCFLGKSTITVLRFKLQYTKNINLDQISVIFPRLYTENPGLELYFPKSREIFPKFPSRDLNLNPIHDLNHDLV